MPLNQIFSGKLAHGATLLLWLSALGIVMGCSAQTTGEGVAATCQQALTGVQNVIVPLPNGIGLTEVAVSANGSLAVADRVNGGPVAIVTGQLTNSGATGTNIGASAKVGSVTSQGVVTLRDSSLVTGFVKAGGQVTQQNGVVVTQGIQQNATLTPINNLLWQINVPSPGESFNLEPGLRRSILPGSFGDVAVKSRAHLSLVSGTYFFSSLSTEPQAVLDLDTRNGPILVYSSGILTFKGTSSFNGDRASVLWVMLGSGQVTVESPFVGSIVAPNGNIRLAPRAGARSPRLLLCSRRARGSGFNCYVAALQTLGRRLSGKASDRVHQPLRRDTLRRRDRL